MFGERFGDIVSKLCVLFEYGLEEEGEDKKKESNKERNFPLLTPIKKEIYKERKFWVFLIYKRVKYFIKFILFILLAVVLKLPTTNKAIGME